MNEEMQLQMFGCLQSDLDQVWDSMIGMKEMSIMGMMSNAQHEIEHGMNETARQTLNQAKYFLSKSLEEKLK